MIKLAGASLIMVFCLALLSEAGFRGKRAVSLVCSAVLFSAMAKSVGALMGDFLGFADGAGVGSVASSAAKIIGAGYLFGICSDMASEMGEGMVAKVLISAGKIEILLIVLPYFDEILKLGMSLIK